MRAHRVGGVWSVIDLEAEVYDAVSGAVLARFPDALTVAEYVRAPARFPCVSIVEMDNIAYERTQDSASLENHARVMFEVNAYSNKQFGKKAECRALAASTDAAFARLGFTRTFMQPVPNLEDATIFRIIARYTAVIAQNKTIYGR